MDEKILRETFDHNLNESFRLKQLENCRDCTYNCGVWCRALKFFMDGNLYGKSRYCLKELNEPSPGNQVVIRRRLYSCALTLWCGLWLHYSVVGGLAYVL